MGHRDARHHLQHPHGFHPVGVSGGVSLGVFNAGKLISHPSFRLLFFFIAIAWVCFHNTTTITRVVIAVTTVVSALLVAKIIHNGDWRPEQSVDTLSASMARMKTLVKAARRFTRFGSWSGSSLGSWSGRTLGNWSLKGRKSGSLSSKRSSRSCKSASSQASLEMSEAQLFAADFARPQPDEMSCASADLGAQAYPTPPGHA